VVMTKSGSYSRTELTLRETSSKVANMWVASRNFASSSTQDM
jgi:hypothetical protein